MSLEQESLKKYQDYIEKYYVNTNPCDRSKAERAFSKLWQLRGEQPPLVIWVKSPRELHIANDILDSMKDEEYKDAPKKVMDAINAKIKPSNKKYENYGSGQFSSGFFSSQEFYFEKKPDEKKEFVENKEKSELYFWFKQVFENCLFWHQFKNVCVACERPIFMSHKYYENGEFCLHNEEGPSCAFGDGQAIYFLNNRIMPKWLIETPADDLTFEMYFKEKNIEIKKEIFNKMGGLTRLFSKLSPVLINVWKPTKEEVENVDETPVLPYELYEINLPISNKKTKKIKVLKMEQLDKLGVTSTYIEGVANQSVITAEEAFFSNRPDMPQNMKIMLS